MDVLAQFLDEECELHPMHTASASSLYHAYCEWCKANGERSESQRGFGTRLSERGLQRTRGTAGRIVWLGIRLLASEPSERYEPDFHISELNLSHENTIGKSGSYRSQGSTDREPGEDDDVDDAVEQ